MDEVNKTMIYCITTTF